ncbi:MAG: lipopolysaccharide biosynthesis protein [Bryobacteraceae bacterium]
MERAPRLHVNFSWTLIGNVIYGASQWAILSLLAKRGGAQMLGEYTFAAAVAGPVSMLSHLNLRAVLATDAARRHPFGDYLAVRLVTAAAALAAIAALGGASGRFGVTLLLGAALAAENVSDIYYGALQRRERMDAIARSLIARSAVSVAALGAALVAANSLAAAAGALAAARLAVLVFYDRPAGSKGEELVRTGPAAQWEIFKTALPLGVVLMLVSLTTNLPRYAVERHLGSAQLGVFAAAASFTAVAQTAMNALGQAATPRLAALFNAPEPGPFRRLAVRVVAVAAALGAAGILGAALLGRFLLALLYRPEFAAYHGLLNGMMGAGALFCISSALGYVNTSARAFRPQMLLYVLTAAVCAASSAFLVPAVGLAGAAASLALAASVQIAGHLLILRRSLDRHA